MIAKFEQFAGKMQQNKYLRAISSGFASLMPIIIIGALSVIIDQLAISQYQDFLINTGLKEYLQIPNLMTNGMLALYAAFSIAYHLALIYDLDGFMAGLQGILAFLLVQPTIIVSEDEGRAFLTSQFGAEGIITALILSILTVEIIRLCELKGFYLRMPDSVPEMVERSFRSLTTVALVIISIIVIRIVLQSTDYETFPNLIAEIISAPLRALGSSWIALVIIMAIVNLLWFFGIHGHLVALSVLTPIYIQMDLQNLEAYQAGETLPNIIGNSFIFTYASGACVLFGLVFGLMRLKSERYNTVGKLATVPMLFGIGEPLAYGVPYVMNFRLFIPVVFSASINSVLAYFATLLGFLPKLNGIQIQGGMPVVFTGFIAGGWKVATFQVFLCALNIIIWWPFVKGMDKDEEQMFEELNEIEE
ncbi:MULTISPECIES: PTS sugar transporter subunit IIC [Aerococcus]|nr:PTS transporter subunit EIIC [Aerococcus urinae]MDK7302800.1 PTS transporter subunit EIIC [Aerococcus urinae]MDK7801416.1 PTS transporter subunit EIIC [Aerococcus urinae]MDK8655044.1 PTS transporter subunit EIIC [Aerococcus urinae]RAV70837.1 hypothetical protein DBT40_06440 [Aerococcus urinae]RAW04687.1 hypothetical protein DBT41_06445 [Aerococcus urinae]